MRRTTMAALALMAALTCAPLPALAAQGAPAMDAGGMDGWAMMAERHMRVLMDALKLTPEQRSRVEAIRARHLEQTRAQRTELHAKRRELFRLVRGADATREQAIAKQREIDALQARLSEARLGAWFEARAVLTSEQLAQLEKLPAGKHGHRRHRGQERHHGHPGQGDR